MFKSTENELNVISFAIDISNVCNLKCSYCYANWIYKERKISSHLKLSKHQLLKIIDEIKKIKKYKIIIRILGGEPTLHQLLYFFIDELLKISQIIKIMIVSNGTKMVRVYENNIVEYHFSCHFENNHHNYKSIISNIKALNRHNIKPVMNILMHKDYLNDITKCCDDIKKQNLNCVLYPVYIFDNHDNVNFTKTIIPEPRKYLWNKKLYTFRECYNHSFLNHLCYINIFSIFSNGDVEENCTGKKYGNLFKGEIHLDKINLSFQKCLYNNGLCHDETTIGFIKI